MPSGRQFANSGGKVKECLEEFNLEFGCEFSGRIFKQIKV
jgi:hypothetical protein